MGITSGINSDCTGVNDGTSFNAPGTAWNASLAAPRGLTFDTRTGLIYIMDNYRLRAYNRLTSTLSSISGSIVAAGLTTAGTDGLGTAVSFSSAPTSSLAVDSRNQIVYVPDGPVLRRVLVSQGVTTTIASSSTVVKPTARAGMFQAGSYWLGGESTIIGGTYYNDVWSTNASTSLIYISLGRVTAAAAFTPRSYAWAAMIGTSIFIGGGRSGNKANVISLLNCSRNYYLLHFSLSFLTCLHVCLLIYVSDIFFPSFPPHSTKLYRCCYLHLSN